jgi:endonuclease/exonuclease/phosphatase family metal-dependent hydrolase
MALLTVATANTCSGELLRAADGLAPFREAGVQVIGLQEVFGLDEPSVAAALRTSGYRLAHLHGPGGLAIAHDPDTTNVDPNVLVTTLQPAGPLLRWSNHWHERAMLSASVALGAHQGEPGGQALTFSTAHLIVFARALARGRQVVRMRQAMQQDRLRRGPHIVTGDMNHYPGPMRTDLAMHVAGGFQRVPLEEPTWRISGSKHEWLARVAATATHRDLSAFDAQLDTVLARGLDLRASRVVDIASDHRGVVCTFDLAT